MKESIGEMLRQRPDAVVAFVAGFGLLMAMTFLNSELPSGLALAGWIAAVGCFAYPIATS